MTAPLVRAIAVLLVLGPVSVTHAYEEGGHFYTVHMIVNDVGASSVGLALAQRVLISICAQLPDKSTELDAVQVYRSLMLTNRLDYGRWFVSSDGPVATVGRMAVVQQLLHGLTGGRAATVRSVALEAIDRLLAGVRAGRSTAPDPDALCALGMAYHLLGDSVAHRMLKNTEQMYPTGKGHAADFTLPDHPLGYGEQRRKDWNDYASLAATRLGASLGASSLKALASAQTLMKDKGCSWWYGYCESLLFPLLPPSFAPPVEQRKVGKCQDYVDGLVASKSLAPALKPSCAGSWEKFRVAALDVWKQPKHGFNDPAHRMQVRLYELDLFK